MDNVTTSIQFSIVSGFENFVTMSSPIWDHNRKSLHRLAIDIGTASRSSRSLSTVHSKQQTEQRQMYWGGHMHSTVLYVTEIWM